MAIIEPFEEHAGRYEDWFRLHDAAYRAEVRAISELLPRGPAENARRRIRALHGPSGGANSDTPGGRHSLLRGAPRALALPLVHPSRGPSPPFPLARQDAIMSTITSVDKTRAEAGVLYFAGYAIELTNAETVL